QPVAVKPSFEISAEASVTADVPPATVPAAVIVQRPLRRRVWFRISATAACLLFAALGTWLFLQNSHATVTLDQIDGSQEAIAAIAPNKLPAFTRFSTGTPVRLPQLMALPSSLSSAAPRRLAI